MRSALIRIKLVHVGRFIIGIMNNFNYKAGLVFCIAVIAFPEKMGYKI